MDTNKPANSVSDYISSIKKEESTFPGKTLTPTLAEFLDEAKGQHDNDLPETATSPAPAPAQQPKEGAMAKASPASPAPASVPAPAPSADLEQPAVPVSSELSPTAGKRPLAHFGQALPVTKSKANRKLVLQLTPEMYQYFAYVANLPGLDGVPLSDMAVAILQAWREDYRPEIKKAHAAFKA